MSEPFDFICEHFTAGAIGPAGHRVFFLQAGAKGQVVSLKCEKQQVGALGEYLDRVLTDLPPGPAGVERGKSHQPTWGAGFSSGQAVYVRW